MTSTIFKKWITSNDDILQIILSSTENKLPVAKAIVRLIKCQREYNNSSARLLAHQVFIQEKNCDKNLFCLFMLLWSQVALKFGNISESENLLLHFDKTMAKAPELLAYANEIRSLQKGFSNNHTLRDKYLLCALKLLDKKTIHHKRILCSYGKCLSESGRLKEIDLKLLEYKGAIYDSKLFEMKTLDYFNTYQLDLLQSYVEKNKCPRNKSTDLLIKKLNPRSFDLDVLPQGIHVGSSKLSMFDLWLACTFCLRKKRVEEALVWAKTIRSVKKSSLDSNNLFSYILIREELANKNFNAAHKLMDDKVRMGDTHYLDNFFYARIVFLKGDKTEADRLFKISYEHCLYYSAMKRLFMEMDLSCELLKDDVLGWLKKNKNSKAKPFKLNKPKEDFTINLENNLLGVSGPMKKLKSRVKKYASINTTILITGETGVGKEEVAKRLHALSAQKEEPFLVINCGAISESLLHSELFGHLKGSFTGATKDRLGIFEMAGNGVVLLDEIGEISEQTQVALLRVLESKEVKPLGSSSTRQVNCKILTATHKDLEALVAQGTFREDLYYRLNRLEVHVPSLREREGDVIIFAHHFLKLGRTDNQQPELSENLKKYFIDHSWPGNIRQLKNTIDHLRLSHSEKLFYDVDDLEQKPADQLLKKEMNSSLTIAEKKSKTKYDHLKTNNERMQDVITNERTPLRRIEVIKELFITHKHLTRNEIIKYLNMSPGTITADLKKLMIQNIIEKVEPTLSPRTHYFQIRINLK